MVAQDFGEPALRHTTNVFISVDDVNDVVPKFEQDEQRYAKIFRKTQRGGGGGLQYWEVTEKGWVGFSKRGMTKQLDTFTDSRKGTYLNLVYGPGPSPSYNLLRQSAETHLFQA